MPQEPKPVAEILVPMDFSDCSKQALHYAMRIAAGSEARLHLLYVSDDPILNAQTTDQKFRDEYADQMSMNFVELLDPAERERFRTTMSVRFGTAYHEIEEYANENDIELIVIGNVGRSAIADVLLGSVAKHVIRKAVCPVLSVK
jgi:nucleotide-binding universal stress UspA family protein